MMLLTGCDNSTGTNTGAGNAPNSGAAPPAETWVAHQSTTGGYSALFPVEPKTTSNKQATNAGEIEVNSAMATHADTSFAVATTDYPPDFIEPGDAETMLDDGRDGMVATYNGTVVKDEKIKLGDHPGRAVTIEADAQGVTVKIISRFYLVDNRLYQLMIVGMKDKINEADATKFLDSFKLTGK
jgi:hypothetical protein